MKYILVVMVPWLLGGRMLCEYSYFDRAQDLPSPALNCNVRSVNVNIHLNQAGVLQSYNEVIAQRK